MIRKLLPTIIIIAILFAGCGKSSTTKKNKTTNATTTTTTNSNRPPINGIAQKGKMMPDFSVTTIDGKSLRVSDYRGKVLIIDVWATTCPPCRREIPGFANIVNKYSKNDFAIIGISTDNRISKSQLKGFIKKIGINYPIAMITENRSIMSAFADVRYIPTTYIIDTNGIVRDRVVGAAPQSYFENEIQALLKNRSNKKQET